MEVFGRDNGAAPVVFRSHINLADREIRNVARISGSTANHLLTIMDPVSMMDNKIINLADPTNPFDAVNLKHLDERLEALDGYVKVEGTQDINGTKTFTVNQNLVPDPTQPLHLVNKKYVDSQILATNTWLTSVDTLDELLSTWADVPDPNQNYLCKVLHDQDTENNGVYQRIANSPEWRYFSADTNSLTMLELEEILIGYVARAGGNDNSMLGRLVMGNQRITNLGDPQNPNDAATKQYIDSLDAGNVKLVGDQTIAEHKTFSQDIRITAPGVLYVNSISSNDASTLTLSNVSQINGNNIIIDNVARINAPDTNTPLRIQGILETTHVVVDREIPQLTHELTTKAYVDRQDAALDIKVNGIETRINNELLQLTQDLASETTNRLAAVSAVDSRVTTVNTNLTNSISTNVSTLNSRITTEIGVVDTKINTTNTTVATLRTDTERETARVETKVDRLIHYVNTEAQAITYSNANPNVLVIYPEV